MTFPPHLNLHLAPPEAAMVLLCILLVLSVAIPAARRNRARREAADCSALLDQIRIASAAFAQSRGTPPASLGDLVPDFFSSLPRCPAGGRISLPVSTNLPPTCSIGNHAL